MLMALEILDQYDYHKLEIQSTSGKETYQLTLHRGN